MDKAVFYVLFYLVVALISIIMWGIVTIILLKRKINRLVNELNIAQHNLGVCLDDIHDAAGELLIPVPKPGTDMAKVLAANAILKRRLKRVHEASQQ